MSDAAKTSDNQVQEAQELQEVQEVQVRGAPDSDRATKKHYVSQRGCCCPSIEVRERGFDETEEPKLKIQTSIGDYICVACCPLCHARSLATVSGATEGKVRTLPTGQQVYLKEGAGHSIGVAERGGGLTPNIVNHTLCSGWVFWTKAPQVTHFVALADDGREMIGIVDEPVFIPRKLTCCKAICMPCMPCCLPKVAEPCCASQAGFHSTADVRGPRMEGHAKVGHITSGKEQRCCLHPCRECAPWGGVMHTPSNITPDELVGWVMLWGLSIHKSSGDVAGSPWKNSTSMSNIEEMK